MAETDARTGIPSGLNHRGRPFDSGRFRSAVLVTRAKDMDKPISVGDLVQVVRDCCGLHLGATFIVGDIDSSAGTWQCRACRGLGRTVCAVNYDDSYGSLGPYFPLAWLKRIPPLEELEDEKRDEEVTA